jgi:hypothetical protein
MMRLAWYIDALVVLGSRITGFQSICIVVPMLASPRLSQFHRAPPSAHLTHHYRRRAAPFETAFCYDAAVDSTRDTAARITEELARLRRDASKSSLARVEATQAAGNRDWNALTTAPMPTLGDLHQPPGWATLHCAAMGCHHSARITFASCIIRWGRDASSDRLRTHRTEVSRERHY